MNPYAITFIFIIILAVAGMSLQYLKGIGKSFQNTQDTSSVSSTSLQQQEKQQAQDAEEQRRAYMESVKQRMRDNQRR